MPIDDTATIGEGRPNENMATAGDRIDKFTLVRQLGAGGMGSTWEAVRQVGRDFEQRVAIKLAEPDLLRTADGVASFRREAALAASLRHPNIAAVLDVDEKAGYIVCELVDGADLRAVLRAAPGGRMEPSVVVHVVAQITRGLSHAHRRILRGRPSAVIHRDMSPGNVVIDYDGNAKIVDFGIAKVLAAGAEVAESVKGKLSYMAPEQAMGSRMDGRVDQYALGVIAYEALSGVRPNDRANEGATLACILEGKHVPLQQRVPGLPFALCRTVERMLALRPADRYENMEAVLDALAELTPKLTVHRSLVPLVMAAHQPHTIVSENGRFVSRPVEAEPLWAADNLAEAVGMSGRARRPASLPSLAVTLGNTQPAQLERAVPLTAARPAPPPLPIAAVPPPFAARAVVPARAPRRRSGRWFWTSMTALGMLLFALVLALAVFPQSLQRVPQLAPALARFGIVGDFAETARHAAIQLVRPAPVAPAPAIATDQVASEGEVPALPEPVPAAGASSKAEPQPSAPAKGQLPRAVPTHEPPAPIKREEPRQVVAPDAPVRVRVQVQPSGKVWLDDRPAGDATPELELSVAPGPHVFGAGDEHGQVQRKNVQVSAEKLRVVHFDLASP